MVDVGEVAAEALLGARCRDLEHPRGGVVALLDLGHALDGLRGIEQVLRAGFGGNNLSSLGAAILLQ